MPRLSRLFVRTAMLYFLLGFTVGALLLAHKGIPFYPALWGWLPAHIEFLFIGWVVQLVMGVAFWIVPRFWEPPRRGNETGAQVAYVLINVGVWLVVSRSLFGAPAGVLLLGRLVEAAAAIAFALHLWQRVLPRNYQPD